MRQRRGRGNGVAEACWARPGIYGSQDILEGAKWILPAATGGPPRILDIVTEVSAVINLVREVTVKGACLHSARVEAAVGGCFSDLWQEKGAVSMQTASPTSKVGHSGP